MLQTFLFFLEKIYADYKVKLFTEERYVTAFHGGGPIRAKFILSRETFYFFDMAMHTTKNRVQARHILVHLRYINQDF